METKIYVTKNCPQREPWVISRSKLVKDGDLCYVNGFLIDESHIHYSKKEACAFALKLINEQIQNLRNEFDRRMGPMIAKRDRYQRGEILTSVDRGKQREWYP